MRFLIRFVVVFVLVAVASTILIQGFGVPFGQENFWNNHGLLFLLFIALFPRLTLLFSSVSTGGVLWWLGWLFAPRLLVAVLATINYWHQNPFLVVLAWLVTIGGETTEKYYVTRYTNRHGTVWVERRRG